MGSGGAPVLTPLAGARDAAVDGSARRMTAIGVPSGLLRLPIAPPSSAGGPAPVDLTSRVRPKPASPVLRARAAAVGPEDAAAMAAAGPKAADAEAAAAAAAREEQRRQEEVEAAVVVGQARPLSSWVRE